MHPIKIENPMSITMSLEKNCPYCFTCWHAAKKGHLGCLIRLRRLGHKWDILTPAAAAQKDNLSCLIYAYENGCNWNQLLMCLAANNGNLTCLKYGHKNGCEWGSRVTKCAAKNGNLACLKYSHIHGCPVEIKRSKYPYIKKYLDSVHKIRKNSDKLSTIMSDKLDIFKGALRDLVDKV
jgi:hypothetical protein